MKRPTVLLSLNAGSLMVLGGALFLPLPIPKPAELPPAQPASSALPLVNQNSANWPEALPVQRSLFRPVTSAALAPSLESVPVVSSSETATDPAIVLRGILSDGSRWIALIEIEGEPERRLVAQGDPVGAWVVGSVAVKSVTLSRRGEQRKLPLDPP